MRCHALNVVGLEVVLAHDFVDCCHRRDAAVGCRRGFEADAEYFPALAEPGSQVFLRALADQRTQKSAVWRFQHVRNSGVTQPRELGRIHAALRRASRMKPLGHRALLHGHQAGALRPGDAQRVLYLHGIETQQARRRRSGDEHARRALVVKTAREHAALAREPHADAAFVACDQRGDELASRHAAVRLGERQHCGHCNRAWMQRRLDVDFIELKGVRRSAVDERGVRRRGAVRKAERRRLLRAIFLHQHGREFAHWRQRRAENAAAQRIQHAGLRLFNDRSGQVFKFERGSKFREPARGAGSCSCIIGIRFFHGFRFKVCLRRYPYANGRRPESAGDRHARDKSAIKLC